MLKQVHSERGHIGVTLGSVLAVVGTVLLAIGLGHDSNGMSVAGAIVLGVGTLMGMNAPHIWMRSVYRRLDKVDPDDRESMPEKRFRTQL